MYKSTHGQMFLHSVSTLINQILPIITLHNRLNIPCPNLAGYLSPKTWLSPLLSHRKLLNNDEIYFGISQSWVVLGSPCYSSALFIHGSLNVWVCHFLYCYVLSVSMDLITSFDGHIQNENNLLKHFRAIKSSSFVVSLLKFCY
jgi:hypothetical protein